MMYRGIDIIVENKFIQTKGIRGENVKEIRIPLIQRTKEEYTSALTYLIDYVLDAKPIISVDQTIGYCSWILKFADYDKESYLMQGADINGEGYETGIDYAIKVVSDQRKECDLLNQPCVFPTFNQNIVISRGVYEGLPVDAVRYPSPLQMSGWWITTDLYDDNTNSLMNVHYYHVAFKRPDVLRFLALPDGHRFSMDEKSYDVWFDQEVLK